MSNSLLVKLDGEEIETLRLERASFVYEDGPAVFQDVTIDVPNGRGTFISGGARQGRSTFLRVLAGLVPLTQGEYLLNGRSVNEMSFEEFLPLRRRMGFSFDFGGLIANRTVWQNLMLPLEYHRALEPEAAQQKIEGICREFGLWEARDSRPANISGGSRKACAVARAFVMDPEMLLLDDPFVALDPLARDAVLHRLEDGRSSGRIKHLIMTSQDESWAARIGCDAAIEIQDKAVRPMGERAVALLGRAS